MFGSIVKGLMSLGSSETETSGEAARSTEDVLEHQGGQPEASERSEAFGAAPQGSDMGGWGMWMPPKVDQQTHDAAAGTDVANKRPGAAAKVKRELLSRWLGRGKPRGTAARGNARGTMTPRFGTAPPGRMGPQRGSLYRSRHGSVPFLPSGGFVPGGPMGGSGHGVPGAPFGRLPAAGPRLPVAGPINRRYLPLQGSHLHEPLVRPLPGPPRRAPVMGAALGAARPRMPVGPLGIRSNRQL
ncbi:hypothetical protein JI721_16710 [Alicyclobacillus cycloheptanicus]|uniref:Uncharacterized protein n=1 Tax=Alicyclobacillus cycloheptanicus TaxID=1457 RepID=A0ABT9XE77_9BACL|nr:hypothetical protein [Alicyclobacillus cycloheptanicus]MDQ0188587.1 hypothetical protein [Alicyclobacillus cycloheptanicus]WDM01268.1 hypothetical protein JI721_16710 [Alicyclobacillus cycloheptanicus]